MSEGKFIGKAAILWDTVAKEAQQKILERVFCTRCRRGVRITEFTGEERNGDVVLTGKCGTCGHTVVRVLETSEQDFGCN